MNRLKEIDECILKLEKNFDECQDHPEYEQRKDKLEKFFGSELDTLLEINKNPVQVQKLLGAFFLLYKELLAEGPWQHDYLADYAKNLHQKIYNVFGVNIGDLFKADHNFNKQGIFNEFVRRMQIKLTANDFKRYPSVFQVYLTMFITEIEEYKDITPTFKMLPPSLVIIDDHIYENKVKGLICTYNVLCRMDVKAFEGGNFYEVIYETLKRALRERKIEITKLVIKNFLQLLRVTNRNSDFYRSMTEELFDLVLEEIQTDSSLPRKAMLFGLLKTLILTLKVNCCNRKSFLVVVRDNLEVGCNEEAEDIILAPVVEALQAWIQQCWCAWNPKTGQNAIASLLKALYTCKNNDTADTIMRILATTFAFSHENEKEKIMKLDTENAVFKSRRKMLVKKYMKKTAKVQ